MNKAIVITGVLWGNSLRAFGRLPQRLNRT